MDNLNLNNLNEQQLKAVKEYNGPMLIVAGAGSGKTMVLTYKIAHIIDQGIHPGQILALTFTNKAAKEMKERISRLIGERSRYLEMGTFHSIFARLLRSEGKYLGYTSNYSIYDTEDSVSVIKKILEQIGNIPTNLSPKLIYSRISSAKNKFQSPEYFLKSADPINSKYIYLVYNEYIKRLKTNNAMDFDDLLIKPLELFNKYTDRLEIYRNKYKYILVDEFQDTNTVQYMVLKLLASKYNNLCVVGDDAQSIYKWRGADVSNILNYEKDFNNTIVVRLEQNYRSTQSILDLSNSVISNNYRQIKKELWTRNDYGEKPKVVECLDEKSESKYIVLEINKLRGRGIPASQISILYRTNAQSRVIEESLIKSTIPYKIIGGTEFYKRKEIKDCLAYLKLLNNNDDSESFLRVINFPSRGIGEVTLAKLNNTAEVNKCSLFNAIGIIDQSEKMNDTKKSALINFYKLVDGYSKNNTLSLSQLIKNYLEEAGVLAHYLEEDSVEATERYENIVQLINSAIEFEGKNPEKGLSEFLQEVSLLSDIDFYEENEETISLMTLHSSKGLEFNSVFVVGCEQGLLPIIRDNEPDLLEEERRLFYVGCTRAKMSLFITFAKNRNRYGNTVRQIKSQFIDEINDNYYILENYPQKYITKTTFEFPKSEYRNNFEQKMPDYESFSQEQKVLTIGSLVEHDVFGNGKVVKISGFGDSLKAEVIFQQNIRKTLMVKFAKLKILG